MRQLHPLHFRSLAPALRPSLTMESGKRYALKGGGMKVAKILGTTRCPRKSHYKDDTWLTRLYNLASRGIRLKDLRSYAFYVSGTNDPSELDLKVRRCEASWPSGRLSDLTLRWIQGCPYSVDTTPAGVGDILGRTRPSKRNWANDEWVRALYVIGSLGVELPAFMEWGRAVAVRKEVVCKYPHNPMLGKPKLRPLAGAESLGPVKKRRALAVQVVESTSSSSSSDDADDEDESQEVDGPLVAPQPKRDRNTFEDGPFQDPSPPDMRPFAEVMAMSLGEEMENARKKRAHRISVAQTQPRP